MNWCIIQIVPLKLWIRYRRCERNGLEVLFTEAGFFVAMVLLLVESCVLFPTLMCGVFVFSSVSAPSSRPPVLPSSRPHSLTPLHSTPLHSTPLHSTPLHSTPLHSTPLHSTPLHSTPLHSTPLHSLTPLLLRGRRGTMCTAKGSDVCPGVPLASLWCPLGSDNVHCQGVGCTKYALASLWRPSGVP